MDQFSDNLGNVPGRVGWRWRLVDPPCTLVAPAAPAALPLSTLQDPISAASASSPAARTSDATSAANSKTGTKLQSNALNTQQIDSESN